MEVYTIKDASLLRKINDQLVSNNTNEQIRCHYYFLLKYFKNNKLTVHEPSKAIAEINLTADYKKRLRSAKSVIKIINKQCNLTLNPKTDGRVHSDITRLSKVGRKYLQYDGEFLAEIDISSAVPYFLFIAMRYYLDNNLSELASKFQYNNTIIYMLDKTSGDIEKSDVESFGNSVLRKQLYEQFADAIFKEDFYTSRGYNFADVMKYYNTAFKNQFGYYFDGDVEDVKKFAKKRLLSMLFAPANSYKFEQLVFGSMFPKILKFINEFKNVQHYKEDESTKLKNYKKHKKLSYFSFQFEAKVMISEIAREFDKLHKGKVAVFTLHDCLLTTNSHAGELKKFMEEKFINLFGVAPNLTIEKSSLSNDYCIAC